MRKRLAIVLAVVIVAVQGPFSYAQDQSTYALTSEQLSVIKTNCQSVQSTLTRIHTNDALSRVHLGQEYETLSTKFMAPMNSRVALAKLDGVAMTKTTVEFNTKLTRFRQQYQQYEQSLLRTLQMKCAEDPSGFYDAVVQASENRSSVRDIVLELGELVTLYHAQVLELRTQTIAGKQPTEVAQ